MNDAPRLKNFLLIASLLAACGSQEGDLEKHAKACESRCGDAQATCSTEPAFADPWRLSCEVACNLDFNDESRPFEACMDAATSCEETDACVNAGPALSDSGLGTDSLDDGGEEDDAATTLSTTAGDDATTSAESTGPGGDESTGGPVVGHPCCDISGAGCFDPNVLECTCGHMPECCSGAWGEVCASVAVANGCLDGCSTLEGWNEWNCTCNTIDVFCPDDPFVGQIIFGTDACGITETDAIAIVNEACEQGNGDCEIGLGSCDCQCSDSGLSCNPPPA